MRVFSILILLLSCSVNVSCEFIPPADEVCLGGSITFHCVFTGSFFTEQFFIINSTSFTLTQINSNYAIEFDLSRINATVDNTANPGGDIYTSLRANITLVNLTKEDNNTVIGCSTLTSGTSETQVESDTLILSSPPSDPTIRVIPIPSNCTVRVHWSYPSPPLTQYLTDSVSNGLSLTSDRTYFSSPLTSGEETSYTLLAQYCLGDVTASTRFTPPSQPEPISCSATYGTKDRRLVIQIVGYTAKYSIETSFNLFTESDNVTVLSGNFSKNAPLYYSREMLDIQDTSNYTVRLTSALRDCIGSNYIMCEVKLNITLMAPITTAVTTVTSTTTTATTLPSPSALQGYVKYIIIAVVLVIVLLVLSIVIFFLAYLLHRSKTARFRTIPKDAKRLSEPNAAPTELPLTDANGEELHYIQPHFSQTSDTPRPRPAFPQTQYADINTASLAMQAGYN